MRNNLSSTHPIQCDRVGTHKGREQPSISTLLLLLYAVITILLVVLIKSIQGALQLFHFLYLCVSQTLSQCFTPYIHCKDYQ